jgi:hypothetical protein
MEFPDVAGDHYGLGGLLVLAYKVISMHVPRDPGYGFWHFGSVLVSFIDLVSKALHPGCPCLLDCRIYHMPLRGKVLQAHIHLPASGPTRIP